MDFQNTRIPWSGWEMVREIGKGSFGTVYEIKHDLITEEEHAALKILSVPHNASEIKSMRSEGLAEDEITRTVKEQAGRILQEYTNLRDLQGAANIVRCNAVHHEAHADGIGVDVYILMELLTPLLDKVDELLKSESQIISFGIDMCNALIACEKKHILHRDIKPENIFVSQEGIYKLGDFGVARSHDHTTYGTVGVGTPSYMAPEVANGGAYNKQADIYSLGIVLYWLLNKRRTPFLPLPPHGIRVSDREEALRRRCSGEPLPVPATGSKELKRIVLKACAFDPKDRYQSAREMREDLARISGGSVSEAVSDFTQISNPDIHINLDNPADVTAIGNASFDDPDETVFTVSNYNQVIDPDDPSGIVGSKDNHAAEGTQSKIHYKKNDQARKKLISILFLLGIAAFIWTVSPSGSKNKTKVENDQIQSINTSQETINFIQDVSYTESVETTMEEEIVTQPVPVTQPPKTPSEEDVIEFGAVINYPEASSYLPSYETKYVKAPKGHSIYVFWMPNGSDSYRRKYLLYEADKVTVLAREDGFSCVIFTSNDGTRNIGWVNSDLLVSEYEN